MTIFFTSDTHFGHRKALDFRAFPSVDDMDRYLIDNWNAVVQPGDTVYHLGDLSFHKLDRTIEIVRQLRGQKHWIAGNHDKKLAKARGLSDLFVQVTPLHEIKVADPDAAGGKQRIVLCHFPMLTWNAAHHGAWMLHGHSHGTLRHPHVMRLMDVGVDPNCLSPVSYESVKLYIERTVGTDFVPVDLHKERR
ncbi:hypothetical protein ACODYM_28820 [Burkholderia gladioli]|uniref:hypothetical protein n=1 Tax=Burkholderia gladioli TaxID=28095 RepID=UPI003B500C33